LDIKLSRGIDSDDTVTTTCSDDSDNSHQHRPQCSTQPVCATRCRRGHAWEIHTNRQLMPPKDRTARRSRRAAVCRTLPCPASSPCVRSRSVMIDRCRQAAPRHDMSD
jgi:hypothetical protein